MNEQIPQSNPQFDGPTNPQPNQQSPDPTIQQAPTETITPPQTGPLSASSRASGANLGSRIQIPVNFAKSSSSKRPILVIVLLIVLLGGGYYAYTNVVNKPQTSTDTSATQAQGESAESDDITTTDAAGKTETKSTTSNSVSISPDSEIKSIDSALTTIDDDDLADSSLSDSELGL
ncbi:MAG: hypothetical protein WCT32_01125 [Patescibacteria group bacterium]|jgi:cytoskeletal protein RodZ